MKKVRFLILVIILFPTKTIFSQTIMKVIDSQDFPVEYILVSSSGDTLTSNKNGELLYSDIKKYSSKSFKFYFQNDMAGKAYQGILCFIKYKDWKLETIGYKISENITYWKLMKNPLGTFYVPDVEVWLNDPDADIKYIEVDDEDE